MNWEVIGATGEWAGALVVVATLFFLAKQIGLSNRIALAEGDRVFMESWQDAVTNCGSDTDTGSLMARGFQDYVGLSQPEKAVFHTRAAGLINKADMGVRLADRGMLTREVIDTILDVCAGVVVSGGGAQWWEENGAMFTLHGTLNEWLTKKDRHFPVVTEVSAWKVEQP